MRSMSRVCALLALCVASLALEPRLTTHDLAQDELQALEETMTLEAAQRLVALHGAELLGALLAPREGVPQGVQCTNTTWCDSADVCSTVCEKGTVQQSPWQQWAMQYQLDMARKQPLCFSQLLATHNSAITLADGYGNRDELYSGYLKWLKTFGAAHDLQTNNQWLSLTDQLNLGIRVLELDVHFVADELRIAHCGGFHSHQLDRLVSLINAIAKLLGRPELKWDSETVGCSPSLSSIAVTDQRPLTDALKEVAAWLNEPRNAKEFLVLFFDDQPDLETWHKVQAFTEQLARYFPEGSVLTPPFARALMNDTRPSDGKDGDKPEVPRPTIEQLVAMGKRVLLLSGTDYKDEMDHLVFSGATMPALCPYTEAWLEDFAYERPPKPDAAAADPDPPADLDPDADLDYEAEDALARHRPLGPDMCTVTRGKRGKPRPLYDGILVRMPACELLYGPWDCHFRIGKANDGLKVDEAALRQVTDCGLNFPAPDRLTPERAAAHIWSWAPDHPPPELLALAQRKHRRQQHQRGALPTAAGPQPRQASGAAGAGLAQQRRLLRRRATSQAVTQGQSCVFADAADGRWRVGQCADIDGGGGASASPAMATMAACRSTQTNSLLQGHMGEPGQDSDGGDAFPSGVPPPPKVWQLMPAVAACLPQSGAGAVGVVGVVGTDAEPDACCPVGYEHDVPHSAVESLLLRRALQEGGAGRALLPLRAPTFRPDWLD